MQGKPECSPCLLNGRHSHHIPEVLPPSFAIVSNATCAPTRGLRNCASKASLCSIKTHTKVCRLHRACSSSPTVDGDLILGCVGPQSHNLAGMISRAALGLEIAGFGSILRSIR